MKGFLKLMLASVLISEALFSTDVYGKGTIADSAEYNAIVRELKEIKAIQDSTYQQRLRAAEKRMHEAEVRRGESQDYELSEYGVMSNIEKNTKYSFWGDDVNIIGLAAIVLSIVSLVVSWRTLNAQKKTEEHTKRAPISVQKGKLEDLPRHFYRNLVCTCSQIFLFNDKSNKDSSGRRICYPSESNVMKLQTLPDDIILPIDAGNAEVYKSMHELRLLFRNYSQEVAVAAEHLSMANITDKSLYQDFDNLLFKPMFLTYKTFDFESCLDGKDSGSHKVFLYDRARIAMVREHFTKLKDNALILLDRTRLDYLSRLLANGFCGLTSLDHKGAINRSMASFFYEPNQKDTLATVYKDTIVNEKSWNGTNKATFTTDICQIESKDGLSSLFTKYVTGFEEKVQSDSKTVAMVEELYNILKAYFDFLKADVWEFKTLFYYMLAIDTAIETTKTGMVNY